MVTLADTTAGYGCIANLPPNATGFTTIELKSNHLGTARDGVVIVATPMHLGATTHVWDAVVKRRDSNKILALFRCTQLILYQERTGVGGQGTGVSGAIRIRRLQSIDERDIQGLSNVSLTAWKAARPSVSCCR